MKRGSLLGAAAALGILIAHPVLAVAPHPVTPVTEVPPLDGSDHNASDPLANKSRTAEKRYTFADYADGVSAPSGGDRPGARDISNHVFQTTDTVILNRLRSSNFLWQFGQFLDHDLGITPEQLPLEVLNIPVPLDDESFPPGSVIPIARAAYDPATGTGPGNPRQQINVQTGWIDASQVYGYEEPRASEIRELSGGRLKVEAGTNLLPRVPSPLGPGFPATVFLCGDFDIRCNETPGLTMMHTLFVREHNRKVAEYAERNPSLTDEQLFQLGRRWVASLMQAITVNEFVPALTGRRVKRYRGHRPEVNGRLALEFVGALFRVGHTLLPRALERYAAPLGKQPLPALDLGATLFQAPDLLQTSADMDALARGFKRQRHERVDCQVVDGVRDFLVVDEPANPITVFFDLPAINVERGREIGLPTYNDVREALGLARVGAWTDRFDLDAADRLSSVYSDPDQVDLFPGGICERAMPRGHTGELITTVIHKQIEDVRDADRFWYRNVLSRWEIREVDRYRLADVIVNNTGLARFEVHRNAFRVP